MENEIRMIMEDYIEQVNDACANLLSSLGLRDKWDFFAYRSEQRKIEFEANGISYRLHGKGCSAFNENMFLDWDFGYRSRWCGIDPWKLALTLKKNQSESVEYYDGNLIKEVCEQAVLNGEMFGKYNQYYFTIPIQETFEPDFPKEFDTLIVEHFDSRWIIPKNKTVDRFIRKSKWIYKEIDKSNNKYVLRFMLEGREIYTIPYDDIGYPENAVSIMSDDIIRNLEKQG